MSYTRREINKEDISAVTEFLKENRSSVDLSPADIEVAFDTNFRGLVLEYNEDIIGFSGVRHIGDIPQQQAIWCAGHLTVRTDHRNAGVSRMLMEYLHQNVRNDTVFTFAYGDTNSSRMYNSWGMKVNKDLGTFRRVLGKVPDVLPQIDTMSDVQIKELDSNSFPKMVSYDTGVHCFPRSDFLKRLCFHPLSSPYIAMKNNTVCGYCVLTKCFRFLRIAPCFASSPDVAQALLHRAMENVPRGESVSFTYNAENIFMDGFVKAHNFCSANTLHKALVYGDDSVDLPVDLNRVYTLSNVNYSLI